MAQMPAPASFLAAVPERRQKEWIREFVNLTDWFVKHPFVSYLARDGMLNQKQVGVSELLWPKSTTQGELCKWLNWAAAKVYGKRGSSEKLPPSVWVPAARGVGLTKRYQQERHLLQVPDELPRAVFLQSVAEQLTPEQPVLLASTCPVWPDAIDAVAFLGLVARAVQAVLVTDGQSQPCEEQAGGARLFVARARPKSVELSPLAQDLLGTTGSPSLSHWLQQPDAALPEEGTADGGAQGKAAVGAEAQEGKEGQAAADAGDGAEEAEEGDGAVVDASSPDLGPPLPSAEQDLASGPTNPTMPTHWWVVSAPVPRGGSTLLQWQLVALPVLAPGLGCPDSLAAGAAANGEVDMRTTAPVSSCGATTPSEAILLSAASSSASGSSGRSSPSCDSDDEDAGHPLTGLESLSTLRQRLQELQGSQDSASDGASQTSDDSEADHADSCRMPNAFTAPALQAFTQLGWLHAAAWHASYVHWCRTHGQEAQLPENRAAGEGTHSKAYKTQLCRYHEAGCCLRGDQCTYAHGDGELRKLPVPPARAYKAQLCRYHAAGSCSHGESCNFAHGEEELENPAFKTQLCRHHAAGSCSHGQSCTFAHGEGELRTLA